MATEAELLLAYRTKIGRFVTYDAPDTAGPHPPIKLTLESTTHLPKTSSTLSTLTLSLAPDGSHSDTAIPPMKLHHYAYEGWPDFGVPQGNDVDKLIQLIREVETKQMEEEAGGCEIWVHWYGFSCVCGFVLIVVPPRAAPLV